MVAVREPPQWPLDDLVGGGSQWVALSGDPTTLRGSQWVALSGWLSVGGSQWVALSAFSNHQAIGSNDIARSFCNELASKWSWYNRSIR